MLTMSFAHTSTKHHLTMSRPLQASLVSVNVGCLCTSYCVLWCIFSDSFSFLPFWFCHLTCGCCLTLLFSVWIVCRLEIFVPSVLSLQSLTLGTRSVIHTFLLNIVSYTGHQSAFLWFILTVSSNNDNHQSHHPILSPCLTALPIFDSI